MPAQAAEMYMRAAKYADALRLCERYHLAGLQEALLALVRLLTPCASLLLAFAALQAGQGSCRSTAERGRWCCRVACG